MQKRAVSIFLVVIASIFLISFVSAVAVINSVSVNATTSPDNFFSNYSANSVVNVIANISGINLATLGHSVNASFAAFGAIDCGNGANTIYLTNDTYLGDIYNGTCNVGDEAATNLGGNGGFWGSPINVIAIPAGLPANDSNTLVVLYNMTTLPQMPAGCARFGPLTTNFTSVLDFSHVNFTINVQANFTCLAPPGVLGELGFRNVMLLNLLSVNLSTPSQAQKLAQLNSPSAMIVNLVAPHKHGLAKIWINSTYFQELDSDATISFFYLPFTRLPTIGGGSKLNSTATTWVSNEYDPALLISTVNLTIYVSGFSEYNFSDQAAPLITINSPVSSPSVINVKNGENTNIPINAFLNGTGTEPSFILISLNNSISYTYNASGIGPSSNTAGCMNISSDRETWNCTILANLSDGAYLLNVTVWDYGNNYPGNKNSSSFTFTVDTIIPSVNLMTYPENGSTLSGNSTIFVFNVTDASASNSPFDCNILIDDNYASPSINGIVLTHANPINTSVMNDIPLGLHNWTIECFDNAGSNGNTNNTGVRWFTVAAETNPPTNTEQTVTGQTTYAINKQFNFTVTYTDVSGIDKVWMELNGSNTPGIYQNFTMTHAGGGVYNISFVGLAAGAYRYRFWANDTLGNVNSTAFGVYSILQATPTVTIKINGANASNISVTYPQQINVSASSIEGIVSVDRDGVTVATNGQNISLIPGSYIYRINVSGNQNYSDSANFYYNITVSQIVSDLRLYLNATRGNIVIPINTNILINVTLTIGTGSVTLYNNGSILASGIGLPGNITNFTSPGIYNITAVYTGNTNYSADSETWYVTVYDNSVTQTINSSSVTINSTQTEAVVTNITVLQNVTIPSSVLSNQSVDLDLSVALNSTTVTLGNANVILSRVDNTTGNNYTVTIPGNTNITGAAGWDGQITMPTVNSGTFTVSSGTVNLVLDLGSSIELTFSQAVKVVLGGMAGKKAGWARGSTTLTAITTQCTNATTPGITSGECYYDDGTDLVIWTYHFTQFAAYTSTTTTTTTTGGGGGTADVNATQLEGSYNSYLFIGGVLNFYINSVKHQFLLLDTDVNEQTALILVKSASQKATMKVGDEMKFNLDENSSTYELSVKIVNITYNGANVILQSISEKIGQEELETQPTSEENKVAEAVKQEIKEVITGKASIWKYVVMAVIVIALIALLIYLRRRKK